ETQANDAGPISVIGDERSFGQNLQRRIEAQRELSEHAGIAAGRAEFLVYSIGIHTLDRNVAIGEAQDQIAAFRVDRPPDGKKHRTIHRSLDRRDPENAGRQLHIAIDSRAGGLHARTRGVANLAAERAIPDLEGNVRAFRSCDPDTARTKNRNDALMALI